MIILLWNFLLAFSWVALTGQLKFINLVFGLVLGFIVLSLTHPAARHSGYFSKGIKILSLFGYFFVQLILASLRVAHDVVTKTHYMHPAVVAIPLEAKTDWEITLLSNLVSLTPGTLCLDVSSDRQVLYLHVMYLDDEEALCREIKEGFERRILEVMR